MEKLFFNLPKCIINGHVHGRDMKQAHKTTIAQTLFEAVLAGISIVGLMPNTLPAITSLLVLDEYFRLIDRARECFGYAVQAYVLFGVTDNNLAECERALDDPRVRGLKVFPLALDGSSVTTGTCGVMYPATILAAMKMCLAKNKVLEVHCDDPKIIAKDKGFSIRAEVEYVKMIIALARQVPGVKIIICHVSCQESAELILAAQAEGMQIAIELCAQYLWFDDTNFHRREDLSENFYLCLNRLRSSKDREYLIGLLSRESNLIIVSADHAPHARAEKIDSSGKIPSGVPSLFHTVPVVLTHAIQRNIPEAQVARLLSFNAAALLGITVDRELVKTEIVFRKDDFLYNRGIVENPFLGSEMYFPVVGVLPSAPEAYF
jgi:dihydroorotase